MIELNKIAARQLALKLELEPRLKREMSVLFSAMSKDMRALYATTGQVLNADEYEEEIKLVLKQHYRRVARVFGISLRQQLVKKAAILETKGVDDEVDAEMMKFIAETTGIRSKLIVETTQKDINFSVAFSISVQPDTGIRDNAAVAATAQKEFGKKTSARTETIAITETQTAAEGSKSVEARTVAQNVGVIAGLPPSVVMQKEWVAVLDSRTRDSHVLADGQRVGIDGSFLVGGERLQYPSDSSLGATAGNIINCRCISAVVVNDEPAASAIDSRVNPATGFREPLAEGVIGL